MCDSETRTRLPLVSNTASACCSTEQAAATDSLAGQEYPVEGLTCGHCVQSVVKAVAAVPGVHAVTVDLVPGGTSRLRISGSAETAAISAAVAGSGYSLSER